MPSTYDLLRSAARGLTGLDHSFLKQILGRREQAIPDLVRFAAEDLSDYPVDLEPELVNLFRALRTPEAIPFLSRILRQRPDELGEEIIAAFREIGEPAVAPLADLYNELGDEKGSEIPFLLCSLGIADPRVVEIVTRRLDIDPWDAAVCIQILPAPAFREAAERKAAELAENSDARRELETALEAIGAPVPPEPPAPFDVFSQYPETADPVFEVLDTADLLGLLRHESVQYRTKAAESLQNEELTPELKAALLDLARNDPASAVRSACWQALGGALEDKTVRTALIDRLNDESAPLVERAGALIALTEDPDTLPHVHRWAEVFYREAEVRAKALRAMWRTFDRGYATCFPPHVFDADSEVQREAILGVGYLGISSELQNLEKMFDDEDLREHALHAYALAVPGEITRGRIRGLFRKIEQVAGTLSEAESELVEYALDHRLALHGVAPVFHPEKAHDHAHCDDPSHHHHGQPGDASGEQKVKVARNDPCPCGSGKKFKKCCGAAL